MSLKNLLMNESFKTVVEILTPMISALVTAVVAWILRGKWENKKRDIELQRLAMDLRKEELDFRNELMVEVHKLQKQVFVLEQTVHQQSLEMEVLRQLVQEKDSQIEALTKDKAFDKAAIVEKNNIISNYIKTTTDGKAD
jgi:phosphate/sulfate permease